MKRTLFVIIILGLSASCQKQQDNSRQANAYCQAPNSPRRGAVCKDGTMSAINNTGGACWGHGGVDYWLCK